MERLRQDDPQHFGPYVTLARLDADSTVDSVPERRYLARTAGGERTVLVCAARADADPARWAGDAESTWRHRVPRFLSLTESGSTPEGVPWYGAPYTPLLPLPAVLAAYGGPLPEDVVRRLGAGLAEGLAAAHSMGLTHAGVSPAAVLLTPGGPLLGGFGTVRAGAPGLDPGCLAVELASGGQPHPLGDIFALGAVLAYALTGHTVPERDELPPGLRQLIASCLARDPADRPQSAQALLCELVRPAADGAQDAPAADGAQGAPAAASEWYVLPPVPTLFDHASAPPLPGRVVAALADQSAQLLAVELPAVWEPFPSAAQKVY
ncbi:MULTISPECIES: serine/threonine protein kinase [unclassified Streptomyces]|uniref:serine/threonine protein kinase n=1 Tax=unclassified Streptomyces TaxID=2593676 RepID=UPI001BE51351|nr:MULTISPECIES: serine/threonine protein kinase [unclassified Streptomyces]MBT2405407.1 serine/threonine protein kinase [Streptomyces sp. ISL-21]MBT2608106.1 serine/threonine protein kinase [Streptomyces sp. ISL-87]